MVCMDLPDYLREYAQSVRTMTGQFVADASGVLRPQIHVVDHLGSVRAIVDKSGNIVERDSYYPYGERWNDGSVEQADNRYRYNGKESQSDFGLPHLDYGARLYDPATGRWVTQDPLSEKYYGISPYAFCAGNPMKYVDMDGMDIWEIDKLGNVVNRIEDKKQDTFYIVENSSSGAWQRTEQSISFDYGTIFNNTNKTVFKSKDEESGARLFKFLSDNTIVEFGLINTLNSESFIMSDNNEHSINMHAFVRTTIPDSYTLTSFVHSHPRNSIPSGYLEDLGDIGDKSMANKYRESNNYRIEHYVYQPKYNRLIQYDENSIIPGAMDFSWVFFQ